MFEGNKRLQTQVLPIAENTVCIRSLDWDRNRFDIEFACVSPSLSHYLEMLLIALTTRASSKVSDSPASSAAFTILRTVRKSQSVHAVCGRCTPGRTVTLADRACTGGSRISAVSLLRTLEAKRTITKQSMHSCSPLLSHSPSEAAQGQEPSTEDLPGSGIMLPLGPHHDMGLLEGV
jgi:hypothetical protein